jgi:hypothetical protein
MECFFLERYAVYFSKKVATFWDKPAQSRLQYRNICRKDRGTVQYYLGIRTAFMPHYIASL